MSKAFTRESDDHAEEPLLPSLTAPGTKRYVTPEGAERLRKQGAALLEEKSALLREAPAGTADPARLRRLDASLQKLQRILDSIVVAAPPSDPGKVEFGATVRIRDQHGDEDNYQLVGVDEAEPGAGRISSASPLAQALMNRRAGDLVRFQSPAGEQQLTILSVAYGG